MEVAPGPRIPRPQRSPLRRSHHPISPETPKTKRQLEAQSTVPLVRSRSKSQPASSTPLPPWRTKAPSSNRRLTEAWDLARRDGFRLHLLQRLWATRARSASSGSTEASSRRPYSAVSCVWWVALLPFPASKMTTQGLLGRV